MLEGIVIKIGRSPMGNVCGNWVKGEWNWVWQMGQKARWSEFVSGNGRIKKKRGGASVGREKC